MVFVLVSDQTALLIVVLAGRSEGNPVLLFVDREPDAGPRRVENYHGRRDATSQRNSTAQIEAVRL